MEGRRERKKACQETMQATQIKTENNQKAMGAMIKGGQDKRKATVKASEENMEAAINTIRSELEETTRKSGGRRPGVCRPADTGPPRGTQRED
jgi:hypothetical protein